VRCLDPPRVRFAIATRHQGEARYRSDRGQGLATETQAGHPHQVVDVGDLAGRMPCQRQRQLVAGDAMAVVADPDQPRTAVLDLDLDAAGASVQGVVHQFADHGGRPFDHFARGNLVDQGIGQDFDRHGAAGQDGLTECGRIRAPAMRNR
jgi:hypothetical protein